MLVLTPTVNAATGQQQINASFTQGDNVGWWFLLKIASVPINLTGANVKMTIGMEQPVILSTQNGGISLTDPAEGQFQINIPSATTAAFAPGTYNYDVWVEQGLAQPAETQYATGQITVNPSTSAFP